MAGVVAGTTAAVTTGLGSGGSPDVPRHTGGPDPAGAPAHRSPAAPPSSVAPAPVWRVAWGSTMGWGYGIGTDTTVRELAAVPIGGSAVRVRISNLFGTHPLAVGAASVGDTAGSGASLIPTSVHPLTFAGAPGTTIPTGGSIYSDPVGLSVGAGQVLGVSVFVAGTDLMTVHPCCSGPIASYATRNGAGNHASDASGAAFGYASPWARLVDAVDVLAPPGTPGSIVVVGDSISDGFNSTLRWTDVLQRRIDLLPVGARPAVVNEALTANALTAVVPSDATTGGGPPGLVRLGPDALDLAGVTRVILFLGTNDLYFGATGAQLEAGLAQAAAQARRAGTPIAAVTLLPRRGSERWNPTRQGYLQAVNDWIMTSGTFDAVLDLSAAVADVYDGACDPTALFPPYDSGDHLHPDAAGATALADAVDTTQLGLPPAPPVPQPVRVTPTPGCRAAGPLPHVPSSSS